MRYGALSAKVKALYGKRLRFADFEQMAALPNEQSVLDYLRGQPGWSAAVAALGGNGYVGRIELEHSLRQEIWKEYEGLSHFVPRDDKALVAFPVRLAELEDILTALRRLKAHGRTRIVPNDRFGLDEKVDRKALFACEDYDALLAAVKESIYYAPLLHVGQGAQGEPPEYTTTEALLRSTYYSHIYRLIHRNYAGETKKVLLRSMGEQIDLLNVVHLVRLKTYFPGDDRYYAALFPFNYRLKSDKIKALCDAKSPEELFALLEDTPYANRFESLDARGVEDYYRRAFYIFNKRQLITGAPSVYTAVAYLNVKESEFKALVNVIESVKYGARYDEAFAKLVGE